MNHHSGSSRALPRGRTLMRRDTHDVNSEERSRKPKGHQRRHRPATSKAPEKLNVRPPAKSSANHQRKQQPASSESIRQPPPTHDTAKVPAQAQCASAAFETVPEFGKLSWALNIDGKDAVKGCDAYGSEFYPAMQALRYVLETLGGADLNMTTMGKISAALGENRYRAEIKPLSGDAPACFRGMTCNDRQLAIAGIPQWLLAVTQSSNCTLDYALPKVFKTSAETADALVRILKDYNSALQSIGVRNVVDNLVHDATNTDAKLLALARFLRMFAWLHPLPDANGRMRTLLLQHEVRRLGLGQGAFMFNNNRDVFFISESTYVAKIVEGIAVAKEALATKKNPWLDRENSKAHYARFPPTTNCHEGGSWGSTTARLD